MHLEDFDHPLFFLFIMTLGVLGMMALLSWFFSATHLTGPLGLVKGGVVQ
jgi:hypothetical protein